jgi:ABC-type glycerol-3-phosphate transport system substrate-binding protein
VTVEKQIAALPFGAVVPCVIGSKALLKDFSLKSISHWYWDDFIKALPQASSSRKPPLNLSNLYNIIISHGFHFLEESSNNIKCLRKAIKTIEKLLPFSDVASKRLEWKNELKGQEHAFIFRYSSTQSELNELYPEKFICLPYPTGKTGKTDKITLGLFMSSVTEYPLECWELMKFLTAPKQQFDLWEKQLLIPAVDIDLSASTNPHSFLLENANQNQERLFEHNFLEMIELYLLAPEIMAIRNNTQNTETTIDRINFKSELLREMNDKNIQKYHQKVML